MSRIQRTTEYTAGQNCERLRTEPDNCGPLNKDGWGHAARALITVKLPFVLALFPRGFVNTYGTRTTYIEIALLAR